MNETNVSVPNGSSPPAIEVAREAQWQTQAQQMRAQDWFNFASDGYLLTSVYGVVCEANYAAAALLGVRKEFLLGKPLGLFLAEQCHKTFYERLAQLATASEIEEWEAHVSRPIGQPRYLILRAISHADAEGVTLRWVLRDITELREAQRQALQAERLAAIGQMAAGMAHEGRNALQRIQACVSLLTMRLHEQPECLDLLGRIQRAQDDLQRLFEDVRNYAVAPRLQRRWHDLQQIWREAWNELLNRPEWPAARLSEDIAGIDAFCPVDPFYLKHVFRNLLENALSCGVNPVRVAIHCRPTALGAGEAICLRLHDNGPGISAEARTRLFEPFCTTKAGGTGLGLAICKRIIEAHGGKIEANGNGSSGAEIVITLPRRGT